MAQGTSAQTRKGWSLEEEKEITTLLNKYFEKGERPSANFIKRAIRKSKDNNGLIHLRSVSSLKNKIHRMLPVHV